MVEEPLAPTPKDVFRLRLYFSDSMTREGLKTHLNDQIQKHTLKHRYLSDIMERSYQWFCPPFGTKECGDYMVLEGAILRESSYLQWLNNCLKRI